MKKLIILFILLLTLPCYAQDLARLNVGVVGGGVAAVAGCTTPATHTYDQGFEAAFPITGWTVSNMTSGETLTGTPPAASCTKGMLMADQTIATAYYDASGFAGQTHYFRIDFNLATEAFGNWGGLSFMNVGESTTPGSLKAAGFIFEHQGTGVIYLNYAGAATVTLINDVVAGTWYRITGLIDSATPTNSWIKVNGGSAIEFDPYDGLNLYYWHFGDLDGSQAVGNHCSIQYGYFAINNSEISSD